MGESSEMSTDMVNRVVQARQSRTMQRWSDEVNMEDLDEAEGNRGAMTTVPPPHVTIYPTDYDCI
jgi:hypothetical protein